MIRLRQAFTLVELLAILAIGATLVALISASVGAAARQSQSAACLAKIRQIGQAALACTHDTGEFPRSTHSFMAHNDLPWARRLAPYLDRSAISPSHPQWPAVFNRLYRCPKDPRSQTSQYSYGWNVYLELDSAFDEDYPHCPAMWRRPVNLPAASKTVLFTERTGTSDHFMAQYWEKNHDMDASRHKTVCATVFADGHASLMKPGELYNPAAGINRFHPELAANSGPSTP